MTEPPVSPAPPVRVYRDLLSDQQYSQLTLGRKGTLSALKWLGQVGASVAACENAQL